MQIWFRFASVGNFEHVNATDNVNRITEKMVAATKPVKDCYNELVALTKSKFSLAQVH